MSELKPDASSVQTLIRPVVRPAGSLSKKAAGARLRRWLIVGATAMLVALTIGAFVFLPQFAHLPLMPHAARPAPPPAVPPPPRLTQADYLRKAQALVEADREKEAAARRAAEQKAREEREARAKEEAKKAAALAAEQARKAEAQARQALLDKHRRIAAYRKQAEALERKERWAEALSGYEAALQLDPTLQFATAGRDRVQPRAALAARFDTLIANPERLFSEGVRKQAHALVQEGQTVAPVPGPVLKQQIQKLTALLSQAETPLRVALESDSATEVTINRVARLGTFSRHELELLPGRYTVTGKRPGYRDVRRELAVLPGKAVEPVVVRCEESI